MKRSKTWWDKAQETRKIVDKWPKWKREIMLGSGRAVSNYPKFEKWFIKNSPKEWWIQSTKVRAKKPPTQPKKTLFGDEAKYENLRDHIRIAIAKQKGGKK